MRQANRSRSTKQKNTRRTRAQVENLREWIECILYEIKPATIRQLFYQLTGNGVIEKTQAEYRNVVVRLCSEMRRSHRLPFSWLADNTRWQRKPDSYSSLEALLQNTLATYRRSVWDDQIAYIEIWCEKDALSGVFYKVTSAWDVPLMVTRGFSSLSFLYSAAEEIIRQNDAGKDCHIYYFGDHDPSGVVNDRVIERDLRSFAGDADFTFRRMAVTEAQIEDLSLPTRPTKTKGTHAKNFKGDSVELDSIPPNELQALIESCITRHINTPAYNALMAAEESERETLAAFLSTFKSNGDVDHAN
jgi:hypothetical protein